MERFVEITGGAEGFHTVVKDADESSSSGVHGLWR
jgi:hypothetical protein